MTSHRAFRTCWLAALLWMVSAQASSALVNIAVNDLAARGVQTSDAAIVSERLRSELVRGDVFRVMDRGQMDVILREQAFQQSGACDKGECAVQIGRLLSVDQMVVGSVGRIGSLFTLSAQLLDVQTGAILHSVNQDFQGPIEDLLSQAVPLIAAKLVAGRLGSQTGGVADLYVTSAPTGGMIELDGALRPEKTPATLQGLSLGVHRLRVTTESDVGEREVALASGELRKIALELKPGKGVLKIVSRPPGAVATLDGRNLAETPFKLTIPAGAHRLELEFAEHMPVRESLVVRPDASFEKTIDLVAGRKVFLRTGFPDVVVVARDSIRTLLLSGETKRDWLPDGAWALAVEDSRFQPWTGSLLVGKGGSLDLQLPLVPRGRFADSLAVVRRQRARSVALGWISGVGSLAAFAVGGYFHSESIRSAHRAEAASAAYDGAGFDVDLAALKRRHQKAVKDANSSLVKAWVGDGIGAALLVTALVHWSF